MKQDDLRTEANALRERIGQAMGMHVATKPSGDSRWPVAHRLHTAEGFPVGKGQGGFFGDGWALTEVGAWLSAPDVACDHNAAFAALEWLRDTHGVVLIIVPERWGGYKVELLISNPEIRMPHDGYVTGPTAPMAIARAIEAALQKVTQA